VYLLSDHALLIDCSAENFLNTGRVINTTAACSRTYRAGRNLSCFQVSRNLFLILPIVDNIIYGGRYQLPHIY